jgi:uncharacterized protein (TIGR03437 family)
MRSVLFVGLFLFLSLSATAQTITVSNLLNPDAPVARESLAAITGQSFSDEEINDPIFAPTTLGGVTVTLDGVPQRIQLVSPTRVVIIVQGAGRAVRALELRTKFNVIHRVSIAVATVWPGIFVQGTGEDSESFYPSGLWTTDGIQRMALTSAPIPVGPPNRPTLVIIQGAGLKLGTSTSSVSVRLNGVSCAVVAVRPSFFAGQDELVFQLPTFLAGNGVMDLIVSVAGRNANFARINLGPALSLNAK